MEPEISPHELASQLRRPEGNVGLKIAEFMNEGNANFYQQLKNLIRWSEGMRVLEVGFGNGRHIQDLLSQSPQSEYIGVDYSQTMVDQAKMTNPRQLFFCRDVLELDQLGLEPCDLIFTINTVYFIENLEIMMRQLKQVLKPHGRLVIGKRPRSDMKILNDVTQHGFHKYSNEEVAEAVETVGMSVEKVVSFTDPVFERRGKQMQLHSDFIVAKKFA